MKIQRKYWITLALLLALAACSNSDDSTELTMMQHKLITADTEGNGFGKSVSLSPDGRTALIGAPYNDDKGTNSGLAYIFIHTADDSWNQQAELTADTEDGSVFGYSVSLSTNGDTALIGAPDMSTTSSPGSAYIFIRTADGNWSQQVKLVPMDTDTPLTYFGSSVSLSANGDTALIGAYGDNVKGRNSSGSAYVFSRAADGSWNQQAKLTAADSAIDDEFGGSVSLSADGDIALIGAENDEGNKNVTGSAYIFSRIADGKWLQQVKLTAMDNKRKHSFGRAVSLSADGSTCVIGTEGYNDFDLVSDNKSVSGSAYIFSRTTDGSWNQQAILSDTKKEGRPHPKFGRSVFLSQNGSTVLVGEESKFFPGSVYIFNRTVDGSWNQQTRLTANGSEEDDYFGTSVSLSANASTILVGTPGGPFSSFPDSAYVFTNSAQPSNTPNL